MSVADSARNASQLMRLRLSCSLEVGRRSRASAPVALLAQRGYVMNVGLPASVENTRMVSTGK
mgnify:CR=1 FL=1